MLSTAIQKDIGEYKAKLFAGLTVRTTVGLAIGIGLGTVVVGVGYFLLGMSASDVSVPVMAVAGASFLASYIEPWGLPFEEAARLFINDMLAPTVLPMKSSTDLALEQIKRDEKAAQSNDKESKKEAKRHAQALREEREAIEDLADEGLNPERVCARIQRERAELYGYEI